MDDREENINNCGNVELIKRMKQKLIEAGLHGPVASFSHSPLTFNSSTEDGSTEDQKDPPETTMIEVKSEPIPNFEDETPAVQNNFLASFSVKHEEISVESEDLMPAPDLDIKMPALEKNNQEEVVPFSCGYCTYQCHTLDHLNKHIKIQHSVQQQRPGKRTFPCPFCSFVTHKGDYISHHIRTHTGEKPYSCNVCGYKCIQKSSLTMHMKRHSCERPYFCRYCDYTAKVGNDLNKHVKEKHNEKYVLSCNICHYKCKSLGHLKEHQKLCTGGDKPYACTICTQKYPTKSSLTTHLKSSHPELNYCCPLCSFTTIFEDKYDKHFKGHAK